MVTLYVSSSISDDYTVDGSADQVQINQALAYANTNGTPVSPVTVYLRGPYTYDLTDYLLAGSNTILTGDTTAVIRLHNSAGWPLWKPLISQISGVTPQNFTLSNITLDGNYANQPEYSSNNWGDGYYPGLYFHGSLANPVRNFSVHDALLKNTLTDGIRLSYADGVTFYNNKTIECMHEGIYVLRSKNVDIYNNDFTIRTNSGSRCYNSQNVNIYNNVYRPYNLNSLAGNFGIQIEDNSASSDIHAQNIDCYGNTLMNCWGGGIWCIDITGSSEDKVIKIHDNTISGCGRITTTSYNAGICVQGFNKIQVYNNVLRDNYNAGILIANAPSGGSGYLYYMHDNVISGTLDTLATSSSYILAGHGYGMANRHPDYVTVSASNNLVSSSFSGDYYQVSNINDIIVAPVKTVPVIRINEDDELVDYYVDGYSSYVNGYPIKILGYEIDTDQSIGTDKPPGSDGWVLGDFGADGSSIALRCYSLGKDEARSAIAAWKRSGRTYLEPGGDSTGYQVSGIVRNHTSKLNRDSGDPMGDEKPYPYSVNFYCDEPFESSLQKHVRARKLTTSGEQWSADNVYAGNVIKNASFEEWSMSNVQEWTAGTQAATDELRCVRYSPGLSQYCIATSAGIQKSSNGDLWTVPSVLPSNSNMKGLTWGSCVGLQAGTQNGYVLYSSNSLRLVSSDSKVLLSNDLSTPSDFLSGRWVAVGYTAGTAGAAYSSDGDTWYDGTTPAGNYEDVCYIRDDATQKFRYVAVGNNKVIYSDDGGETWTSVSVSAALKSVCYSTSLKRLIAVSSAGDVFYSDDFAESWTETTAPSQAWQEVVRSESLGIFVAISSDGTQQVATSETGLIWILQDTPYASSTVTPGEGDISTTTFTSDVGLYYTSAATAYSSSNTSLELTKVLPALTNGNFYRLDQIDTKLRTVLNGKIAYMKVTIQAASLYSGVETQLAEWTNNTTNYVPKTLDLALESATNEMVTLRYYMKTSDASYRAAGTELGYKVTTVGSTGGTVTYNYNQWSGLCEAPEVGLLVAVAKTGTGNRVMSSIDAGIWTLGESASDSTFESICFSPNDTKFVAVAIDGDLMTSDTYGTYSANGWTLETSGSFRSEIASTGFLSLGITGNGVTAEPGLSTQQVTIEGGATYALSGYVKKVGAEGSAVVDIYAGGDVVKSITWTAEGDFTLKQEYIKFETTPLGAQLRIHGSGTPPDTTSMYFDNVRLQKLSEFDIDAVGSDILTSGTVDTVPDIAIEAMGTLAGSVEGRETPGESYTHSDLTNVGSTIYTTYQLQDFFNYTITGTAGKKYRIDQVGIKGCTASSGGRCDSKIEVYFDSTLAGTYTFSSTSVLSSYTTHSATPLLISEAGQSISFKYYLKSSTGTKKAYIRDATNTVTEVLDTPTVAVTAGISVFNTADPLTKMKLCNKIFPGVKISVNADGTGSIRYIENFIDSSYQSAALSRTGDSFIESERKLNLTGSLVWEFDTLAPITGIPFVRAYVLSGTPKLEISYDNSTWYACDSNSSASLTNTLITQELDNSANCRLYGKTKFYLRLSPASGTLSINSFYMFSYLITVDTPHPVILATGAANTFQVDMTNNVPCIVSLKYPDKHWMV
jgi:parallel beta-helix repeat protein